MALPRSVILKHERAGEHFDALNAEVHRYLESKPSEFVPDPNASVDPATGMLCVYGSIVQLRAIPEKIPIIIGDLVQNLSSALDYLVWELVLANKQAPGKHNAFPICKTASEFADATQKRKCLAGVHPDAATEIEGLQPYADGKDVNHSFIRALHQLTNINKHRRILLTVLKTIPAPQVLDASTGEVSYALINPPAPYEETRLGPFPIVNGKVQVHTNFASFVAFDESPNDAPARGFEIVSLMEALGRIIGTVVFPRFERFF
jgi:hypothetical protein